MKFCVRELKDNEMSFAHRKDASLSIDDEEDTRNRKRIKRLVNDKTKISKFEMKRKLNSMHLQNQILTDYTGSSTSVQPTAESDDNNDSSSSSSSDDSSEQEDSDETESVSEQISDVVYVFNNLSNQNFILFIISHIFFITSTLCSSSQQFCFYL